MLCLASWTEYLTRDVRPQTPGRSRVLNTALAYPTPESRPRKNRSALHDDAAQAGPRIGAVSLPTPADTDSDSGGFQDALEEMVVDETPLTNQERDSFLQQVYSHFPPASSILNESLPFDLDIRNGENNQGLEIEERLPQEREPASRERDSRTPHSTQKREKLLVQEAPGGVSSFSHRSF